MVGTKRIQAQERSHNNVSLKKNPRRRKVWNTGGKVQFARKKGYLDATLAAQSDE